MDLKLDPTLGLAELQLTLFMAAITALVELAKTTDKDHIKLRALTEVARLCNPAKRPAPTQPETSSASDVPQAPANSQATSFTHAPLPVAREPGSDGKQAPLPRATEIGSVNSVRPSVKLPLDSLLPLNRRQRRMLARLEANDRKRRSPQAA